MGAERSLKGAEAIFLALLTIGLMGLLFLIIYGNLSGNLGWLPDSTHTVNETVNLTVAGSTLATSVGKVNPVISSVVVYNVSTPDYVIGSGNYTVTGVVINASLASADYFHQNVNVSYTTSYDGISERNTEAVIGNLTAGATQFFTFSSVWFILTAITILIGIVLGVIALVRRTSGGGLAGKGSSKSQFPT